MTSICLDSLLKKKASSLTQCLAKLQHSRATWLKDRSVPSLIHPDLTSCQSEILQPSGQLHGHVSRHRPISSHIIPWGMLARSWQKLCSNSLRVFGYFHTTVETVPFIIFTPSLMTRMFSNLCQQQNTSVYCLYLSECTNWKDSIIIITRK